MTFIERLKALINNLAVEQDWNIYESAIEKRDIEYRRGKADAYGDVVHRLQKVLDEFPEEPVRNSDKMTLTELAYKLRKIFLFDHLTISPDICGQPLKVYAWLGHPHYETKGRMWLSSQKDDAIVVFHFEIWNLKFCVVNLSEYADKDGNIDYSKCIVEVIEE